MLSAIVTGATGSSLRASDLLVSLTPLLISSLLPGILGREIVHALAKDPQQWRTVHALSRSQKEKYPSNVKHDTVDLTQDAQGMAKQLEGVEAEYLCMCQLFRSKLES